MKGFDLLPVLYEKDGKHLVLSIGVNIKAKKLLKMFAFLQKSVTNLPLTRRGGIVGSFLLQSKRFDIVEYVFEEVIESASDLVILRIYFFLASRICLVHSLDFSKILS